MTLPTAYQSNPVAVATYDYLDIANGTGVVHFYGMQQKDSVGTNHILVTDENLYSYAVETSDTQTGPLGLTKEIDIDFDLTAFNKPRSVNGTFKVEAGVQMTGSSANTHNVYWVFKLVHYDGSTETTIATATSETFDVASATEVAILTLSATCTKTHFKKGDILRVTVEGWAQTSQAATTTIITFGHDPKNRDGTLLTPTTEDVITQLNLYIPFDIDL